MNSAEQTLAERLAFSHSAKPLEVKIEDEANWLDEWQATWDKLGRDSQ
jgi:hypothetical protein